MKFLTRSTPITLMHRDHVAWLMPAMTETVDIPPEIGLGGNAHAAYECFLRHGALFPYQLGSLLQLVPAQVDDILGELAAAGLVTSDAYPALRTLLGGKARQARHPPWRPLPPPAHPTGRWTLLRSGL